MSSQTVYFTNPSVVSSLQSSVNGFSTNLTTAQITLDGQTLNASTGTLNLGNFQLTQGEFVVDLMDALAKYMALTLDMATVEVLRSFGYGGYLVSNPTESQYLMRKMWDYFFNVNAPVNSRQAIGHSYRELSTLADNCRVMSQKTTGKIRNGFLHIMDCINTKLEGQGSTNMDTVNHVGIFSDGLDHRLAFLLTRETFYTLIYLMGTSTASPSCNFFGLPTVEAQNSLPQSDWDTIIKIYDWGVKWVEQRYRDFEESVEQKFRLCHHQVFGKNAITDHFLYGKRDTTNPANTTRAWFNTAGAVNYGMTYVGPGTGTNTNMTKLDARVGLGATTGAYYNGLLKARFDAIQAGMQKFYDRWVELSEKTMEQVYPYTEAGNTEPWMRNRYNSVLSTVPDSTFKDVAGILPVFPPNRRHEALDAYARLIKNSCSDPKGVDNVYNKMLVDSQSSYQINVINSRLPLINGFSRLVNPSFVDANANWFTGSTGVDSNGAIPRFNTNKLEQIGFIDPRGLHPIVASTGGVISTITPHRLEVGDKIKLVGLKAQTGPFQMFPFYMVTGSMFCFSGPNNFTVGDIVQLRDEGWTALGLDNRKIGLSACLTNPTLSSSTTNFSYDINRTIWNNNTGPFTYASVRPIFDTLTGAHQYKWTERAVKSVDNSDPTNVKVVLSTTLTSTGATGTFTDMDCRTPYGVLNFMQNQTLIRNAHTKDIYTVTSVQDPYTFTCDTSINIDYSGVHIEYDFNTLERKQWDLITKFTIDLIKNFCPYAFSDLYNSRCFGTGAQQDKTAIWLSRAAGSAQLASSSPISTTGAFICYYTNTTGPIGGSSQVLNDRIGTRNQYNQRDLFYNNKASFADLTMHEGIGHGSNSIMSLKANKSEIPTPVSVISRSAMFVEGCATIVEEFLATICPELCLTPERKLTQVLSNKIYYTPQTGTIGNDAAFETGDTLLLFSLTGADRANMISAGFTFPNSSNFVQLIKVASEGNDVNGTYFTYTKWDGSALSLSNMSFTDTYLVEINKSVYIQGAVQYAYSEAYTSRIGIADIMLNYKGQPATLKELLWSGVAATENRDTNRATQQISYAYGKLLLNEYIDEYIATINSAGIVPGGFNMTKFFSLGHVKGMNDAINLSGVQDSGWIRSRINDFTNYVLAGGDPTKYYVGQV